MSYCKYCGTLLNGGNYCSSCGSPINGPDLAQPGATPAATATNSFEDLPISELFTLHDFFMKKDAQYTELAEVTKEITKLSAGRYKKWRTAAIISAILILFGPIAPIWMVATIVCIIACVRTKKKDSKRLEELLLRQSALDTELRDYYATYPNGCPIDFKYTSPMLLGILYCYVNRGASTIGEAIKLHEKNTLQTQTRKSKYKDYDASLYTDSNSNKDSSLLDLIGSLLEIEEEYDELKRQEQEDRWEREYQRRKEEEEFIRKSNDDWYERQRDSDY